MIEKDYATNIFTVECDGCDYSEEFDTDDDWGEMIAEMKANGWRITKVNGEWSHFCSDCADPSNQIGA